MSGSDRSWRIKRRAHRARSAILVSVCFVFAPGALAAMGDPQIPTILAFGDSLTAGLGLPREAAFPSRLETWLQSHSISTRVINAGISGDTTANGLARLDRSLAEQPDFVIVELGANDALRGIDPATVRDNLHAIIAKIKLHGAELLLTGMLAPPNWGEEYRQAFDRIYPELARSDAVPIYPFFLEGVALKPQLNQPDGLHPNERGVMVLVDRIAPVIRRWFMDHRNPAPRGPDSPDRVPP